MKNLDIIFDLLSYEGRPTNDPADAIKLKAKLNETAIASISRQQIQIADSVTDQAVTLPDPNSDYLIILTDRDVSIKLSGGSTALPLKTRANGTKTLVFYIRGPVTGLTVSNASGASANIDIIIANK